MSQVSDLLPLPMHYCGAALPKWYELMCPHLEQRCRNQDVGGLMATVLTILSYPWLPQTQYLCHCGQSITNKASIHSKSGSSWSLNSAIFLDCVHTKFVSQTDKCTVLHFMNERMEDSLYNLWYAETAEIIWNRSLLGVFFPGGLLLLLCLRVGWAHSSQQVLWYPYCWGSGEEGIEVASLYQPSPRRW